MIRVVYDMLFYFGIIIIVLNLIFGVIIDTFADLRNEKQKKDDIIRNTCFICGLERRAFDHRSISFETHIQVLMVFLSFVNKQNLVRAQHVALFVFYCPSTNQASYRVHGPRILRIFTNCCQCIELVPTASSHVTSVVTPNRRQIWFYGTLPGKTSKSILL